MKKIIIIAAALLPVISQAQIGDIIKGATKVVTGGSGSNGLTNQEVVDGLKEALTIGAQNSSNTASKLDGFYKNPLIKIPFPPEVKQVETTAKQLGLSKQVDKFVLTLNRAAETAAKDAAPIFINAVKTMSIADGFQILNGGNNAATTYLRTKTEPELKTKFKPVVQKATGKVQLTKYWTPIMTTYNKVPLVQKVNPDLNEYVTNKAIDGLFKLIAQEETKIRTNANAQVTSLLQKVFGKH